MLTFKPQSLGRSSYRAKVTNGFLVQRKHCCAFWYVLCRKLESSVAAIGDSVCFTSSSVQSAFWYILCSKLEYSVAALEDSVFFISSLCCQHFDAFQAMDPNPPLPWLEIPSALLPVLYCQHFVTSYAGSSYSSLPL